MKKVGIIRCQKTEDMCQGKMDFKVAGEGKMAFQETGPVRIIGFVSCGGCPGKLAVTRAESMVKGGAEVIVLASCISKGNPIGFPCPNFKTIYECIKKRLGGKAEVFDWTH